MYSALHFNGERLYDIARRGEKVDLEAREIEIESIELLSPLKDNKCSLRITCGKGTYIRTLCHDIGQKLGVGGTLKALRRTQSGKFSVADALTIEQIKEMDQQAVSDYLAAQLVKLAGEIN
jgi:tRNA pseudouridine55 synthase